MKFFYIPGSKANSILGKRKYSNVCLQTKDCSNSEKLCLLVVSSHNSLLKACPIKKNSFQFVHEKIEDISVIEASQTATVWHVCLCGTGWNQYSYLAKENANKCLFLTTTIIWILGIGSVGGVNSTADKSEEEGATRWHNQTYFKKVYPVFRKKT